VVKDKERAQPRAGRLDLLLQDPESAHRYEVELQLGETDEAHIIRTIEYWDVERKRYPQYDHTLVWCPRSPFKYSQPVFDELAEFFPGFPLLWLATGTERD
jgi:hypothetical protein